MALLEGRVDRLEEALVSFMTQSAQGFAAIREGIAEINLSNARTDRQLLALQQQADKDRDLHRQDLEQAKEEWQQEHELDRQKWEQAEARWQQAEAKWQKEHELRKQELAQAEAKWQQQHELRRQELAQAEAEWQKEHDLHKQELVQAKAEWQQQHDLHKQELEQAKAEWQQQHQLRRQELEQAEAEWQKEHDLHKQELEQAKAEWQQQHELRRQELAQAEAEWQKEHQLHKQELEQAKAEWQQQHELRRQELEQAEAKWQQDYEQAEKERKDFNRRLAEVTDSQGLMIENMVWPNLKRIAGQVFGGGDVKFQAIRLKRRHPEDRGRLMEIDLLAVGDTDLLICEAKSKVGPDKVREFQRRVAELGEFFPEYDGLRVWPMIASIAFDASAVRFMTSHGVLALGFGDETMEIVNPEALQAR